MPSEQQNTPRNAMLLLLAGMLLLATVGLGLAVELTSIHYNTHQNPEYHSMCAISEGFNCETVALSPYSIFLGLPVSVFGMLGYFVILLLTAISLFLLRTGKPLTGALFGFSGVAFLSSLALATISFTRIDSLCVFCMGTYGVNAALMVLSGILLRQQKQLPHRAIIADLVFLAGRPGLLSLILAAGLSPIGIAYWQITPYWNTAGFDEIPVLKTGVEKDGSHWIGAAHPSLTIIEYTDYECPYCRKAHRQLRALIAKYADRVRVVHRHFPLDQACNPQIRRPFHQFACQFSMAAECAAQKGKFWEMNDAIFSSQERYKSDSIDVEKFAIQLGLDRSEFLSCMTRHAGQKNILRDIQKGVADQVTATPSFVAKGKTFKGRLTEATLLELLKETK